jgi:uncharacterized beta-barrel protein YwiB (DUF1934 family)
MVKDVIITVKGFQPGTSEESIKVEALGSYHYRNGKHYIQYEEISEEENTRTRNTLKVSLNQVDMMKKGTEKASMTFCLKEQTRMTYQTPYGFLDFDINTHQIKIQEMEHEILIELFYSLSSDNNWVSDNLIKIKVRANA